MGICRVRGSGEGAREWGGARGWRGLRGGRGVRGGARRTF